MTWHTKSFGVKVMYQSQILLHYLPQTPAHEDYNLSAVILPNFNGVGQKSIDGTKRVAHTQIKINYKLEKNAHPNLPRY